MPQSNMVGAFDGKTTSRRPFSTEQIWGKPVMANGYTAIPSILIRAQKRLGINTTQFNILVQLLEYWRSPERSPFPSKRDIARRIGLSDKTVQLNIRALEKAGLVRREQRKTPAGDWGSNLYHLDGLVERVKSLESEFTEERSKRAKERKRLETPKGRRIPPS